MICRNLVLPVILALFSLATSAQNVVTWHNDNARTGQDLKETILTPSNVNSTQFGKLFSLSVDDEIFGQPLYVANVNIVGQGVHNVVYVATENDSVYAFDAGGNPTTPLWHTSFTSSTATAVPCGNTGTCVISPTIGITGTPVINTSNDTLYVVAFTLENGTYFQRLHALNITSGAEKFGGPVVISALVAGTGAGSVGGTIAFTPLLQNQRSALLLLDNVVYIAWASFGDLGNYHGWVMGYNAKTLAQVSVFNDSPNGSQGGIWHSAGGLSADSTDNVYAISGNGTFDANTGGIDYGDSFLKFNSGLSVLDYFTPDNQSTLDDDDIDLGSGAGLIVPTQPGPYPDEVIGAGKEGLIYVVNRNNMGKFSSSTNNVIQTVTGSSGGYNGSPAYFDKAVFYSGVGDYLDRYTLTKGLLSTSPVSKSPTILNTGGTPSISANGATNGIVWVIDASPQKGTTAVLHAYQASSVATELYNSQQNAARDTLGKGIRFSVPTIANGMCTSGTRTDRTTIC
jgi:hypothetical protein